MSNIICRGAEYIYNIGGVYIKKSKFILTAAGLTLIIILLFLKSRSAAAGAFDGLILSAQVLIPSLFVFMCICEFTVQSGFADILGRLLAPVTAFLFGLPGELSAGIILSFLGGYPAGARCAHSLYKQGRVSREDASRMILFAVNSGPAFIIFGIGDIMYQSRKLGIILFLSTALASLLTGVISGIPGRLPGRKIRQNVKINNNPGVSGSRGSFAEIFVESVSSACSTMLLICAFVVMFSAFTSAVMDFPLPNVTYRFLPGILEVTSGITSTVQSGSPALTAALLSFGGFSVHFQIMAVSRELFPPFHKFLLFRILSAALAGGIAQMLLYFSPDIRGVFSNGVQGTPKLPAAGVPAAAALIFMIVVFLVDFTQKYGNEESSTPKKKPV